MLWVFVTFSGEHSYNFHFPIEFTNIPQGYAISNVSDQEVVVELRGLGWELAKMTFGRNPHFHVSVQNRSGSQSITLRNAIDNNSWLSTAVEVNEISPDNVYFRMEKVKTKVVPIKADVWLEFSKGYGLVSPVEIVPDTVEISGPESLVNSIDTVKTIRKIFEDVERGGTHKVALANVDNLELTKSNIDVSFDVQKIVDKEIDGIPVEIQNIPPSKDLTLLPGKIDVIVRGGINKLGKITPEDIKASIKFSQALKDTLGYVIPHVELPEYMELIDIKPRHLEYIIQQY